jgi:hypothetical protein
LAFDLLFKEDRMLRDAIAILNPELMEAMRQRMCGSNAQLPRGSEHLKFSACEISIRTVAGRKSLSVLFTLVAREADEVYRLLLVIVPHGKGVLLAGLAAESPAEIDDAAVNDVFAGIRQTDVPEPEPEMVRLTPSPGFSLDLPFPRAGSPATPATMRFWAACVTRRTTAANRRPTSFSPMTRTSSAACSC